MNEQVEQLRATAEDELRQVSDTGDSLSNEIKTILEETASFSKRSMESTASFLQKLTNQNSIEGLYNSRPSTPKPKCKISWGNFKG